MPAETDIAIRAAGLTKQYRVYRKREGLAASFKGLFKREFKIVEAVRDEFGDIPLMTDANAAYTLEHLPVFQRLEDFGLLMYEQPLGGTMLRESAELQSQLATPICLDESIESVDDLSMRSCCCLVGFAGIKFAVRSICTEASNEIVGFT